MKFFMTLLLSALISFPVWAKTLTVYAPMTCEKCVQRITKSLEKFYPNQFTQLEIDLDRQSIQLESEHLTFQDIEKALEYVSYPASKKPLAK